MNKIILSGWVTSDPWVNDVGTVATYTVAVRRPCPKDGLAFTDYIRVVAFGNHVDYVKSYIKNGMHVGILGHLQTGHYVNFEGRTVYTTEVVVERHEIWDTQEYTIVTTEAESFDKMSDDDIPFM